MGINKIYKKSGFSQAAAALLLLSLSVPILAAPVHDPIAADSQRILRIESVADGIVHVDLSNGISADIYSTGYLSGQIKQLAAGPVLALDGGEQIDLITDIEDPLIYNKGDGSFHPFMEDQVIRALGEIDCAGAQMDLDIYLLPYPRRDLLFSSTRGSEIFLSPQVRELSFEGAAYIVTHETGHTFQNRFLPGSSSTRWNEYKRLRGIADETVFHSAALHAYRPVEIFAEDFRALFGGNAARYDGAVENPELPAPETVAGLEEFYLLLVEAPPVDGAIVRVENYPNPFNPQTEIWIALTDEYARGGSRVTVRIYSVTGALVRELFSGVPERRDMRLEWDGRDAAGQEVASAAYFCMVRAGEETITRKLLLIK